MFQGFLIIMCEAGTCDAVGAMHDKADEVAGAAGDKANQAGSGSGEKWEQTKLALLDTVQVVSDKVVEAKDGTASLLQQTGIVVGNAM